jgi:hypothetical protein
MTKELIDLVLPVFIVILTLGVGYSIALIIAISTAELTTRFWGWLFKDKK